MYFNVAKGSKHTKEKGSSLESQGEEKTQRKHNFVSTKFAQAQILWHHSPWDAQTWPLAMIEGTFT